MDCKHLTVDITNRCNLSCIGCYIKQENKDIEYEDYLSKILLPFKRLGGRSIGFSGGEPMLHKDVFRFIKSADNNGLITSIVTNGMLLDKTTVKKLSNSGLKRIQISLDASCKEDNDAIRGKNTFDQIVNYAIPNTVSEFKRVTLVAVPNPMLLDHITDYLDLAESLNISTVYFRRNIQHDPGLSIKQRYLNFLKNIPEFRKRYRVKIYSGDPLFCFFQAQKLDDSDLFNMYSGCSAGISSLSVMADFSVQPCTRLPIPLGNLNNETLENIWLENGLLKKLRLRNYEYGCGICKYKYVCGGCRAFAYLSRGDYQEEDIFCPLKVEI